MASQIWIQFVVSLLTILGLCSAEYDLPEVVVKEHLGTVFRRVALLDNSVSSWKHTASFSTPDVSFLSTYKDLCTNKPSRGQLRLLDNLCDTYGETLNVYDPVKKMLRNDINDKLQFLDDLIPSGQVQNEIQRSKRSPLDFVGAVSKSLFGTAKTKEWNGFKLNSQTKLLRFAIGHRFSLLQ